MTQGEAQPRPSTPWWFSAAGALLLLSLGSLALPAPLGLALGLLWLAVIAAGSYLLTRGRSLAWWPQLDRMLHAGEAAMVSLCLIVMVTVVFIDVVWRSLHSTDAAGRSTALGLWATFCLLGAATRRSETLTWRTRFLLFVLATVLGAVAAFAIYSVPTGFGWSQRLALVLLMWVGMLGISMAEYRGRHLQVDACRRLVPARHRKLVRRWATTFALALLVFIDIHAHQYVAENWSDWLETDMSSGVFESLPIPYWVASQPIATGLLLMIVRQLARLIDPGEPTT